MILLYQHQELFLFLRGGWPILFLHLKLIAELHLLIDIHFLFQALFLLLEEVSHRPNRGTSKLIERRHIILDDNPRRIERQQGHQWRKVQSAHLR